MAWLPFSIAEAASSGNGDTLELPRAWWHLLDRLRGAAEVVESDPACQNRVDLAAGMRHLLVLLAAGIDDVLRFDPDPILCVTPTSTDDLVTWGMECPDCIYTRALLRSGQSYRLFGNRGTARYVGLQTMNGIAATANELVDELEVDADGNFEVLLSADRQAGNWMRIEGDHPTLTVRHFFYDWDTEVASSLSIERLGAPSEKAARPQVDPRAVVARQLIALLEEHGRDFTACSLAFDQWCAGQIKPWFDDHVYWDADLIRRWSGQDVDLTRPLPPDLIMAAAQADPEIAKAAGPYQAVLALPGSLKAVQARARDIYATGWRPPAPPGPTRDELVDLITAPASPHNHPAQDAALSAAAAPARPWPARQPHRAAPPPSPAHYSRAIATTAPGDSPARLPRTQQYAVTRTGK